MSAETVRRLVPDRLARSPDGRWLAVTQDHMAQVIELVLTGP